MTHPTQTQTCSVADALVEQASLWRMSPSCDNGSMLDKFLIATAAELRRLSVENEQLKATVAEQTELAQSRLEQMQADRKQALEWRDRVAQLEAERVPMTPEATA